VNKPPSFLALWAILGASSPIILAQADRITAPIDNNHPVVLSGQVSRLISAANDLGPVQSSSRISGLSLILKPSPAQQTDLSQLLQAQQDAKSSSYHQWLTPEQYASRFGVSSGDLTKITAWLTSQGFSVDYIARARNYVTFSGTAQQVANAFQTQIHSYNVNGETHFANATAPSVPAALAGLVSTVRGLDNFRLKPRLRKASQPHLLLDGQVFIAPSDFATIYDVNPLYNAGITGAGQKIVVVGQSDIVASDITQFRTRTDLGAANLTQVLAAGSQDPGISPGDEEESDLDIEWSGAVAKAATIVFVYSTDVWTSATYAVDQNLAPVLSMSYGLCEQIIGPAELSVERATVQQGNAEGITVLAASGDYAAADCDEWNDADPAISQGGLAVDAPASFPEVIAMGGTQFDILGGNYFNRGNAISYIPEVVWNDTVELGQLDGGGGGASVYFTQPPWQSGIAPGDGVRHVPDLSFPASNVVDPFFIYSSDPSSGFVGPGGVGGTSCAAPTMAAVVALVNQYLVSTSAVQQAGLGNINPTLYKLAQTQGSAFHDIVNGNNIVPCGPGSPNCVNGTMGWAAGPGYDSASGLGSVDAYNLVHAWNTAIVAQSVVVPSISQTSVGGEEPVFETGTNSWTFTLTLTNESNTATTLTGFTVNGVSETSQIATLFTTGGIAANGSIKGVYTLQNLDVSSGPVNVVFGFSGMDAGGAAWNTTMTVPFTGFQPQLAITSISNAASGQQLFAPGMLIGVYGTGFATLVEQATIAPLPEYIAGFEATVNYGPGFFNQVPVPLMYLSPTQVNVQIPLEIPPGPAQLTVGNPYTNINYNFTVREAAPGIFLYSTGGAASPIGTASTGAGQTVAIYITGQGQVTPVVADGSLPSPGEVPTTSQTVSITVGGVPVTAPFAYIGLPSWSIGVMQINFTIPSGVPTGEQPLVVTIGSTSSLPANIMITD
jgi:uncharacterized protein (TIGR03437 family)